MMGAASEKQVAWTCVGYIVAGVFDKGLYLGRVQERQSKIQWIIRHHKTLGAFLWWDIFDDMWFEQIWMSQKLDGVRPILWFHLVHVLLLSPVVFFKVDGKEPILRDITSSSKLAKDSYGVENDLGSRCKRHQKHSTTCSCLFGVMVQSGYFVGKMLMIQCGQLWAMKNYAWLWPPRELVLLSLH